jgi:phosphoglycerate dehydrogenase-like enzyme
LKNYLIHEHVEIIAKDKETDVEMMALAGDAEIIICTRHSPGVLQCAPKLKLIQKTGAGVDAIPFEAIPNNVLIANTSGANSILLAESTIAMMFAVAKQIVPKHSAFPCRYDGRAGLIDE